MPTQQTDGLQKTSGPGANVMLATETLTKRDPAVMSVEDYQRDFTRIQDAIQQHVVGREHEIKILIHAFLIGGHVIFEGRPGSGKTHICLKLAEALNLSSSRIQGTPDLLPKEVTGFEIPKTDGTSIIHEGPLMHNIVIVDEANRATPASQSAFLESMQSGTVSIGGVSYRLPQPQMTVATQNSLSFDEGTFPLPTAQLDRFSVRLWPKPYTHTEQSKITEMKLSHEGNVGPMEPCFVTQEEACQRINEMKKLRASVQFEAKLTERVAKALLALHPESEESSSKVKMELESGLPEATRAHYTLMALAQSHALTEGRAVAEYKDIEPFIFEVVGHRVRLSPDGEAAAREEELSPEEYLRSIVDEEFKKVFGK